MSLPEESFQEVPNYLSPQERIELYRKQAQSNKLKDKYSNMFKTQEQRKYKLRNPVIHRLLESFKKKYKN